MSGIVVERRGAVVRIAIDRPSRLNALDAPTREALRVALTAVSADRSAAAVILTGTGRAFCVGQDLAAAEELVDAAATVADSYNPLIRFLRWMDAPVIAAVNGPAVGAGMGLALACDLVLMADTASMACAFVQVGLVPDSGVSGALVARLGHAKAFELASSGRPIPAAEAVALGLANEVVEADELADAAWRRAEALAGGPLHALALTKRLLVRAASEDADTLLDLEADAQGAAARTDEHAEGVAAFNERRPPAFAPSAAEAGSSR